MLKVNNTLKRTFTKNAVLSQGDKPGLNWDAFVETLNQKNNFTKNQSNRSGNNNRRTYKPDRNNNGRNFDGNNRRNFNGNRNQNGNYNRYRDNNTAATKETSTQGAAENIKLTGPDSAPSASKGKETAAGEIDLSLFDSATVSNDSGDAKPAYRRNNNRNVKRNYKPREQQNYNISLDKMFEGHSFGIKKYDISTTEEQHTERLSYQKLKNDAKVNVKIAQTFFKENSVYQHDNAFLNPDLIFSHERDALMYTPRIITSKEHVLRDTSFEVFKTLSNEFNYKKEKTKTLMKMMGWEALPEGFDINSPEYDFADRFMLHQEVTRGSTFESVYLNAMRAVRTDPTLVADKMRINSILAGKYDQDFLPKTSVKSLTDFQNQYKGKSAPNVVRNIHKTSEIMANALNFSPAFMSDSSRKEEVFKYLTLDKPFSNILASKQEILRGHSPQKKNK